MSFWGVEIKPAKPFTLHPDTHQGKLQISQATLGAAGVLTKRSVVQCNVGDKSPVLLCALLPDKIESCFLNLQFDEEDEVTFSVLGPRSVHLTGFYLGTGSGRDERDHDDDSDSYGEDIADTDNEDDQSADIVEDGEFDEFIDDGDIEIMPPSKGRKSAVVIEDTDDDEKPANRKGNRKRLKKKYQVSDSDVDDEEFVVKDHVRCKVSEIEDGDIVSISQIINKKDTTESKEEADCNFQIQLANESKEGNSSSDPGTCKKLNQETDVQVSKVTQISEPPKDSSTPSTDIGQENDGKAKKKKRSHGEDEDAKTEHIDIEEQPTAKPSKDLAVPSTNTGLESDVKPKKIKRRNRGEDGAKTKTINQDCTGLKTEEQPNDKLFEPSKNYSSVPSSDVGLESDVMPKKKIRKIRVDNGDAKTENMDQDHVGVKAEEVQPTDMLFKPSKDSSVPSTGITLEITPKKKHRRNHGEDGDAKTKNMNQGLVGVEPEKEQPTDKLSEPSKDSSKAPNDIGLQSDVKPKKKIRKNRGEDVDAKTENMDQGPVEIKPNKKQPDDKTTFSAGHVTAQDNGEVKKKKKIKRARKSAENANDEEEKM